MRRTTEQHNNLETSWLRLAELVLPTQIFNPMHFSRSLAELINALRISNIEDRSNRLYLTAGVQIADTKALTIYDEMTGQAYVIATNGHPQEPAGKIMIFDKADPERFGHRFLTEDVNLQTPVRPLVVVRNNIQLAAQDVQGQLADVWDRISGALLP